MTDNLSDILPLTSNTVRLFSLPPSPFERSCICRNSTRCWALIAMSRETQPSGLTRVTLASTSDNQVNSFRGDWPWQHGDLVIGSIWSNWFIWLVGFKLSAGVLRASLQALGRERERERGGGEEITIVHWCLQFSLCSGYPGGVYSRSLRDATSQCWSGSSGEWNPRLDQCFPLYSKSGQACSGSNSAIVSR